MYNTPLFQYQIKAEVPPSTFPSFAKYESTWHQPWSLPVRFRRIPVAVATSGFIAPNTTPDQIIARFESRWHYAWSEPVRVKRRLHPALNPFTTYINLTPLPMPNLTLYRPLTEPVRIKQGLKAGLQQTVAMPPRLLPTPNVFVTMSAIETNNDIFLAGVSVSNAAARANVSIKEIPAITGANASLEET